MANINWAKEAENWLEIIFKHIAEENKTAAIRLVTAIYQKAETLKEFPLIGYRLHDWPNRHLRVLLYGHYRSLSWCFKPGKIFTQEIGFSRT